jgi:hypothetical protein
VATEIAETIFIIFYNVGKLYLFHIRAVGLVPPIVQISAGSAYRQKEHFTLLHERFNIF